ncbi:MAG: ATP-dependent Clp protease proteolytic subunit [Lachnospiraceae bacterium]|nr:ATP-dependent Clp protease proteolytic subunit [Lachnospiraceae bacterium]
MAERDMSEEINEYGTGQLNKNSKNMNIELITIIGEIEGHDNLGSGSKTTKYEHILPKLAMMEDADDVDGILIIIHTMGGDVEAGLAIAEMIASISKPTVSLVLGGSHSIGVPIAVSTQYSFIVPTGTMVIHPVRMSGTVISSSQTYAYFKQMQNRITGFVSSHSNISEERLNELMVETEQLTKDVGSILVGKQAVEEGLINEVGGIHTAIQKLYQFIEENTR